MEWYPFPGWEGLYEITACGRVRSLVRYGKRGQITGGKERKIVIVRGYPAVSLVHTANGNKKKKTERIHRALAIIFIPNPNGLPFINHIDGNKANNAIENLEWCTHKQNMVHAGRLGLKRKPKGGFAKVSQLTNEQVFQIRSEYKRWPGTRMALSQKYGVSVNVIKQVLSGSTYRIPEATPPGYVFGSKKRVCLYDSLPN